MSKIPKSNLLLKITATYLSYLLLFDCATTKYTLACASQHKLNENLWPTNIFHLFCGYFSNDHHHYDDYF